LSPVPKIGMYVPQFSTDPRYDEYMDELKLILIVT